MPTRHQPIDPDPDWEQRNALIASLVERMTVPGHVLRAYHRLTPEVSWRATSDALRAELRRGHVMRETWEGGSYITISVPARFRLDLEHEVGSNDLVAVDFRPARRRRRAQQGRRRAA